MRYLQSAIQSAYATQKMVFIAGPRQSGKTYFSKLLIQNDPKRYLNWDSPEDREKIIRMHFPTEPGILVLDELHKYPKWRNLLKGLFDKRENELQIVVTGSAKLDYYRKGGDSLQGRYRLFRMHPLSFAEVSHEQNALQDLFRFGGFPFPYFLKNDDEARVWSRTYRSRLVREELTTLEKVSEVSLLEELSIRLPAGVGSPLSMNSLREDIGVSYPTVKRWIELLERLYSVFRIYPYGPPRVKAIKKEAKLYFFDWNLISDRGARFENMIACHLLKWCHWIEDTQGYEMELRYFRNPSKHEVDFVILKDRIPQHLIECKFSDSSPSASLVYLSKKMPGVLATQLIFDGDEDFKTKDGIRVCNAARFLKDLV